MRPLRFLCLRRAESGLLCARVTYPARIHAQITKVLLNPSGTCKVCVCVCCGRVHACIYVRMPACECWIVRKPAARKRRLDDRATIQSTATLKGQSAATVWVSGHSWCQTPQRSPRDDYIQSVFVTQTLAGHRPLLSIPPPHLSSHRLLSSLPWSSPPHCFIVGYYNG